jgi:hypothetical protein
LGDAKLDPDVVEISLGAEARKDPRFLIIWQNRGKNPKAYSEAIKAFSGKLAKKFAMRADPQISREPACLAGSHLNQGHDCCRASQDEKARQASRGKDFRRAMDDIKNKD